MLTIAKDIKNKVNVKKINWYLSCILAIKNPFKWLNILTYKLKNNTYSLIFDYFLSIILLKIQ